MSTGEELRGELGVATQAGMQSIDDARAELLAAAPVDLLERLRQGARGTVRAVGGHGVERVGDRQDACGERDLLTGEAVRVAAAAEALVVAADHLLDDRRQVEVG